MAGHLGKPSKNHNQVEKMGHTYSQIYLHIVWGTKDRNALIVEQIEKDIYAIIHAKAKEHNSEILAIGNVLDHIHVLVKIPTNTLISKMVSEFKGSTSYFINHNSTNSLYWQNGYGILSVSLPAIDTVKRYVENQKNKHKLNKTLDELEILVQNK